MLRDAASRLRIASAGDELATIRPERYTPRSAQKGAFGRRVGTVFSGDVLPKEARRSLKTQQHAHLRSRIDRGVRPGSTRQRERFGVHGGGTKSQVDW